MCEVCGSDQMAFHLYDEAPFVNCKNCDNVEPLVKVITSPSYFKKETEVNKTGEVTREYIEKNREILEKEKQKAKEETYEPS
tara:strand:+ start:809 stop:1054 length:246 start_codon:yes stop_codon:yes gene_type:complete